ncbi:hypothetical protein M404DRAFT_36682 [Pisolithus tinctorius Marx 270]|uniref:Uncharacterized protein n=1 Tax=Pisolithus tinctorius Marx 270 TaxID=870435 RepID=A0A0C3MV90_PISTI|nr:hypothetical protein M404DRAFT_36682 [Pisolithus tinctorius Marx 270]
MAGEANVNAFVFDDRMGTCSIKEYPSKDNVDTILADRPSMPAGIGGGVEEAREVDDAEQDKRCFYITRHSPYYDGDYDYCQHWRRHPDSDEDEDHHGPHHLHGRQPATGEAEPSQPTQPREPQGTVPLGSGTHPAAREGPHNPAHLLLLFPHYHGHRGLMQRAIPWSHDGQLVDTICAPVDKQVPYNAQEYLDEFTKALATGKLREE